VSGRKHRRADGSLRPSYRRNRAKRNARRRAEREATPERQEWLAQFEPGARDRFFAYAQPWKAVWLKAFADEVGLPQEQAAAVLEQLANERHWMKLRKADGMVVGIAPPRKRRARIHVPTVEEKTAA